MTNLAVLRKERTLNIKMLRQGDPEKLKVEHNKFLMNAKN